MRNLFDSGVAAEVKARAQSVRPDSPRQWGKMTPPQAMAHLVAGMELATGDRKPPRVFIGRILGPLVKPLALGNDAPMKRNSPTAPELRMRGEHDLDAERAKLVALVDRFVAAGPAGCTDHPHSFFGRLTPDEWAVLMYKHIDHHLRQFGA